MQNVQTNGAPKSSTIGSNLENNYAVMQIIMQLLVKINQNFQTGVKSQKWSQSYHWISKGTDVLIKFHFNVLIKFHFKTTIHLYAVHNHNIAKEVQLKEQTNLAFCGRFS